VQTFYKGLAVRKPGASIAIPSALRLVARRSDSARGFDCLCVAEESKDAGAPPAPPGAGAQAPAAPPGNGATASDSKQSFGSCVPRNRNRPTNSFSHFCIYRSIGCVVVRAQSITSIPVVRAVVVVRALRQPRMARMARMALPLPMYDRSLE
jgi:hypothetical protein